METIFWNDELDLTEGVRQMAIDNGLSPELTYDEIDRFLLIKALGLPADSTQEEIEIARIKKISQ